MTRPAGFILIVLMLLDCYASNITSHIPLEHLDSQNRQPARTARQIKKVSIKNTIGVIVLSTHYGKNSFVRIYNADRSLWYEFTYYYDDSDGKFEYADDKFKPFAFHPDYFLLVLKCVRRSQNRFEVVVNEETGMKKYVNVDDPVLKFETWERHILRHPSIDFNRKENPVLETPAGKVKASDFPKEVLFEAVEIKGEWLKIRWTRAEEQARKNKQNDFGWIRWKKDDALLIDIFYLD